jgi:hypothetical protein
MELALNPLLAYFVELVLSLEGTATAPEMRKVIN